MVKQNQTSKKLADLVAGSFFIYDGHLLVFGEMIFESANYTNYCYSMFAFYRSFNPKCGGYICTKLGDTPDTCKSYVLSGDIVVTCVDKFFGNGSSVAFRK